MTAGKARRDAYNKAYYEANREVLREKARAYEALPETKAKRRAYKEARRAEVAAWARRQYVKDRERARTRRSLHSALEVGKVKRQPCEVCGAEPAHGHHDDYTKPLEVRWLCIVHHAEHHRNERTSKEQMTT